jgi:tol-pal system protein YbgF
MKYYSHYLVLLLFFLITGCATQGSLDTVHKEIDEFSTRLFTVEKSLGNTQEAFSAHLTTLEKHDNSEDATLHKTLADLQANFDNTKLDMQAQSGRIDDLSLAITKPIDKLQRYHDDDDKRIIVLEDHVTKLQVAIDELTKKLAQQKEVVPTPESIFMQGLDTFNAGDMVTARNLFQNFLETYPQHELAANAAYWIGESYYNEKNYDQAILKYQDVIKKYPLNEKVPAAMLKQGMSFKAIKDTESAKYVLKKLVKSFPKSEETKNAKELLKTFR